MKLHPTWFFLLACLASACATATSHGARPLEVRAEGDRLLGCISHDEGESVVVEDAGVSSLWVGGHRLPSPWGIRLGEDSRALRLEPGQCLVLGQVPEGYVSVEDGPELRDEWPYSFAIRSPEWGSYRTRNYSGVFCLRRTNNGLLVANIPKGPAVVTVDACRRLLDAADAEARMSSSGDGSDPQR